MSLGRFTERGLNAYGGCSGQRMGTYSAWESTATLGLLGGARGAWAPTGKERGRGILCRHAHGLFCIGKAMGDLCHLTDVLNVEN